MKKKVGLKEQYNKKIEQERLREEYGIKEKEVVVVERKNLFAQVLKVIVNTLFTIIRILAVIIFGLLAIIGLAGFIYPNVRAEYIVTLNRIIGELSSYFFDDFSS